MIQVIFFDLPQQPMEYYTSLKTLFYHNNHWSITPRSKDSQWKCTGDGAHRFLVLKEVYIFQFTFDYILIKIALQIYVSSFYILNIEKYTFSSIWKHIVQLPNKAGIIGMFQTSSILVLYHWSELLCILYEIAVILVLANIVILNAR